LEIQPRELLLFINSNGRKPFSEWLSTLSVEDYLIIRNRLDRVEKGNFGDVKSLGDGVYELRFHQRGGFRIYYGLDGRKVVLLLLGGDKSTQSKDIKLAKRYWSEYKTA
jgi:putative addiction module killer protein